MDARTYFEGKLTEARASEAENEKKRFEQPMRLAGWRAKACEQILEVCLEGSIIEDEGLPEIETKYKDNYTFTAEESRKKFIFFCVGKIRTPGFQAN